MNKLIDEFLYSRKLLGCTDKTISDYKMFLEFFCNWNKNNILDLNSFNNYSLYLLQQNIKRVSVRTYLTHLRCFFRWCSDNDYIDIDTRKLILPRKNIDVIDVLTDSEVSILLDCFNGSDFISVRNRLIVYCMLDCGFRRSDIVNLEASDIRDRYFIVRGKGNKQRIVPYGDSVLKLINIYKLFHKYDKYFFVLENGCPITSNTIKMLFQHLKKQTGIKRLKAHLLRHTFATNYLYNGGNLEMLRLILGHTDISTTQVYLHLADTKRIITQKHISYLDQM